MVQQTDRREKSRHYARNEVSGDRPTDQRNENSAKSKPVKVGAGKAKAEDMRRKTGEKGNSIGKKRPRWLGVYTVKKVHLAWMLTRRSGSRACLRADEGAKIQERERR